MTTVQPIAISACLLLLSAPAFSQSDSAARRIAVECSLIPETPIEGVTWTLAERMARHHVPGVAIAVIDGFEVDWVRGYGVRDTTTGEPVTEHTLFQAGSISKPVAATVALRLVRDGKLALDADIRDSLQSWKLPDSEFLKEVKLTLERLLSHRGGVTVHGFLGYHRYAPVPTLYQVLDGTSPANSDPIRVDSPPGKAYRYAGGGTTIVQCAMIDVAGKPFAALAREVVFAPLGMADATYEQPLPVERFPNHCAAHLFDGRPTPGKWHVHPEQCAAGLWISAADLARFAIELQLALSAKSDLVLDQATAERMVTRFGDVALGLFVDERGGDVWFQHGGTNVGFQNVFYFDRKGRGVAILTNGEEGIRVIPEVLRSVASVYGWKDFAKPAIAKLPADSTELDAAPGRYEIADDELLVVTRDGDQLFGEIPPAPREAIHRVGERIYASADSGWRVEFDSPGEHGFEDASLLVDRRSRYSERLDDATHTPAEQLVQLDGRAIDDAIAGYRERFAAGKDAIAVSGRRLNEVAIALLGRGAGQAALAVAKLNVELHPEQADHWDMLGRIAFVMGDKAECERGYQAVLDMAAKSKDVAGDGLGFLRERAIASLAEARGEKLAN